MRAQEPGEYLIEIMYFGMDAPKLGPCYSLKDLPASGSGYRPTQSRCSSR